MCGVVGALTFDASKFRITSQYINRMRDVMTHRGPDGAGTWIDEDEKIGLGHRRLSIIDLSKNALQPLSSTDGRYWVSFNGEIYNHQSIRNELVSLGHNKWRTDHSDTEVLVHAFREWGIECVHRFRGMFAFALWDTHENQLWLVRDRIGVKPLYYSIHDGRIVFASEIKALLEDPDQKRSVNEEALYHYLSFLTTPAPMTLFEGIQKIPGGCYLHVKSNGEYSNHRYWDAFDNISPRLGISDHAAAKETLAEIRESVNLRKTSDVPVGVFLSGGVDSSTNAALFAENETNKIQTFSVGYKEDYPGYKSELSYARTVSEFVGTEHHEIELDVNDLLDFLPRMIELQDEPIADPVCMPVYYVSKLARDHGVIVCQVGEGADELFCGYKGWEYALLRQKRLNVYIPRFAAGITQNILGGFGKSSTTHYEWLRRHAAGLPQFWGGAEAFFETDKKRLLSARLRKKFDGMSSWDALRPIHDRFIEKAWDPSPLNWMGYLDLNLRLPELLLMRVDKMSMGASLEARVPFLDHEFVQLALGIPESIRYKVGQPKRVLKEAVRGLIPDSIIDRPKQGFGVPIADWFAGQLGNEMKATLRNFCTETDYFDVNTVENLIQMGRGTELWFLFNFALWWKRYIA